jgi:1-acyl-sn-glycerol-3-phosphate acyltransferase
MTKRIIFTIWYFFWFFVKGGFIMFFVHDRIKRHQLHAKNTSKACSKMIKLLDIKIKLNNPKAWDIFKNENLLVIANHVSYFDVAILTFVRPFLFVTSNEMKNTPFLGQLTQLGGSLYTDRKKFTGIMGEIKNIASFLLDGFNVVIFPEATSTDGKQLRPFKKSLLQVAIMAEKPILPICIKYVSTCGEPVSDKNRDNLYWYGDMTFLPHFIRLLKTTNTIVEITLLDKIEVTKESDRKTLTDNAFAQISKKYNSYEYL